MAIDEQGYFLLDNNLRMNDTAYGNLLLKNLRIDDHFALWSVTSDGQPLLIEPFDKPLVAQNVEVLGTDIWALWPYEHRSKIVLETLCFDDWGRLVGWTENKIPFVFLKKAQDAFWNTVKPVSSTAFEWNRKIYTPGSYYLTSEEAAQHQFWETRFAQNNTPWDLHGPHPAIEPILLQLKLQKSRFINFGCGKGHDAHLIARKGHLVHAIDVSPSAIESAQKLYPKPSQLRWSLDDVFHLKEEHKADVVFEHTLFCAIPPARRKDLVRVWLNTLEETGYLLGIFFVNPKRFGPPYGCSEWELRELLEPYFRLMYWKRWEVSPPNRHGTELVVFAQKY